MLMQKKVKSCNILVKKQLINHRFYDYLPLLQLLQKGFLSMWEIIGQLKLVFITIFCTSHISCPHFPIANSIYITDSARVNSTYVADKARNFYERITNSAITRLQSKINAINLIYYIAWSQYQNTNIYIQKFMAQPQ